MDPLLTPEDLAELVHKPVGTLRQWRHRGRGPKSVRLEGGHVRYRASDVRAWLDAQFGAQ